MYQCVLQSDNMTMVVWLSNEKEFKVGSWVTLKSTDEPKRRWKVLVKDSNPQPMKDVKDTWTSQDIKRDGSRQKLNFKK